MPNLNSKKARTKILVKTLLRLLKLKKPPRPKLRQVLKLKPLMPKNPQRRRKPLRLLLMLPNPLSKLTRDFHQNLLPQLYPKEVNGKSESETHMIMNKIL
jgi:hypothetical protein